MFAMSTSKPRRVGQHSSSISSIKFERRTTYSTWSTRSIWKGTPTQVVPAPKIDPRTAAGVAGQLQQLLRLYEPRWKEADSTGSPTGVSAALIGVAARFSDILIQRLNQVPQKNLLAFLDLLGAALLPPQAARVPLTFLLAKGSPVDAVVPAGTQAAAPPGTGQADPVIYETDNELVVTAAQLTAAMVRDPDTDSYADYSNEIVAGSSSTPVFHGNRPAAHVLYIGQSQLLASAGISNLSLTLNVKTPAGDALMLKWELWNGTAWLDITPSSAAMDGTKGLTQSGTIQFGAIPSVPLLTLDGVPNRWIRCRLLTPITPSPAPRAGMARASQLPEIRSAGVGVKLHADGLPIDFAYSSTGVIDLSKDFYPFGQRPVFNDALWLDLEEAFSNPGAVVTLTFTVTTPQGSRQTPLPARPSDDLKLRWEIWSGAAWVELGTSTPKGPVATVVNGNPFKDSTAALMQSGDVAFTLPSRVGTSKVNGKDSFWIRVRILTGNYGVEGNFIAVSQPAPGTPPYTFVLPSFQPPSISSLKVMYDLAAVAEPNALLTYNCSEWLNISGTQPFAPFRACEEARPTLYFGFSLPPGRTNFPNNSVTLFLRCADQKYGAKTIPLAPDVSRGGQDPSATFTHRFYLTNPAAGVVSYTVDTLGTQWPAAVATVDGNTASQLSLPAEVQVAGKQSREIDVTVTIPGGTAFGSSDSGILRIAAGDQTQFTSRFVTFAHQQESESPQIQLNWEYWNGQEWLAIAVRDETGGFKVTGVVEFLAPPDFAPRREFGTLSWWLRVRWDSGDYDTDPRVDRVLLNTTMASQAVTILNEPLGSSSGSAGQTFQTTRKPVLAGEILEVLEPEMPSGGELETILQDEAKAIRTVTDNSGAIKEVWVRWHEVPDFHGSGTRSRHYTIDRISGQISFGDGLNGLIPPAGSTNLSLARYRTGGGLRGNQPAGSIVQLKTTLPYIDKVINYVASSGGADAESTDSLISRAPTEIRHRHRAVTAEDYEDLARLASPDVARVLCVPNRDLVADPFDRMRPVPGNVSLIIVPNSTDASPQPSVDLVRRVQQFIAASCPVTATPLVLGPLYLRVNVQVEIGLASLDGAGTLAARVSDVLAAFLHPLTGGADGKGWEFGRSPHTSDLYAVMERIPEVDHVRALTVEDVEDFPGSRGTGRFLVYSGNHSVKLVFEP